MPPRTNRRRASAFNEFDDDELEELDLSGSQARKMRLFKDLAGRWYWIALGAILGILAGAYYLSKAPKRYAATSKLLLKQQVSNVMNSNEREDLELKTPEALNTAVSQLRSIDLLEKVAAKPEIRELENLVPPPVNWKPAWMGKTDVVVTDTTKVPDPARLAGLMSKWLTVNVEKGTRLVQINVEHVEPKVAVAIADAIAHTYVEGISDARSSGSMSKASVLLRESEESRTRLQASEGALASYTRALEMHRILEAKEKEVQALRHRYLPKHPKMAAADSQLAADQSRFLEEFDRTRRSKADEAFWETANATLPSGGSDIEAVAAARHLLLSRIGVLQSEIESQKSVFNTMLTKIEESGVNLQAEEFPAEIENLARLPNQAASPVPLKIYVAGAMGGLMLGLAVAFVLVRLDGQFHSVAQLEEESGYPALAAIAEMTPKALSDAGNGKSGPGASEDAYDFSAAQKGWHPSLVFRPGFSTSVFAEMFRVLRASVSLLGDEKKRKVTLFTSALPGEGKTMISANFALAAASQGKRTILIDLDLRKPALHKIFGFAREHEERGITEYLSNHRSFEQSVITDSGHPMLDIMLGGKRAPNPGELLDSARLQEILDYATNHYDVVVLDSAPLLAVPDTRIIAPLVDNICLVARAEYVPKGALSRTLEILESAGTPPSGLVLNGFREKKRLLGYNYTYGYRSRGYGYGYGQGTYGVYGNDDDDAPKAGKKNRVRLG
jgi:succinoglycan biosynthesis transport protein ExoP